MNNKHQTKVSAHFVFLPVCEHSVLVLYISNRFWFFSLIYSQIRSVCIWMSGFWVPMGKPTAKFPVWFFESPKMKLPEFVRVPLVSDWAIFAVQISKDKAPAPLLTVGLLFIFMHLSCVHLATLKIHSVSQTPPNLKQRTLPEVVDNSGNRLQVSQESHSYLHKARC